MTFKFATTETIDRNTNIKAISYTGYQNAKNKYLSSGQKQIQKIGYQRQRKYNMLLAQILDYISN